MCPRASCHPHPDAPWPFRATASHAKCISCPLLLLLPGRRHYSPHCTDPFPPQNVTGPHGQYPPCAGDPAPHCTKHTPFTPTPLSRPWSGPIISLRAPAPRQPTQGSPNDLPRILWAAAVAEAVFWTMSQPPGSPETDTIPPQWPLISHSLCSSSSHWNYHWPPKYPRALLTALHIPGLCFSRSPWPIPLLFWL